MMMTLKIIGRASRVASLLIISVGGIASSAAGEVQTASPKAVPCSAYDPELRCTKDDRNAKRKKFGLPTLEEIRRDSGYVGPKGDMIVATVALKAGGGLALVLRRHRRGTPMIEIRQMVTSDRLSARKPKHVKISETTWDIIVSKGKALNLVYATDKVLVCGATFTVELMDEKGNIRAPVGDSCGSEPRGAFFDALAEAALAQLADCTLKYPDRYYATLDRLTACLALGSGKRRGRGNGRSQTLERTKSKRSH